VLAAILHQLLHVISAVLGVGADLRGGVTLSVACGSGSADPGRLRPQWSMAENRVSLTK
jgi:hypothetical protein